MPPIWKQRQLLALEVRELLQDTLRDKTIEETRDIAIMYAMMLADLMPIKRLKMWPDLLRAMNVEPRCAGNIGVPRKEVITDKPIIAQAPESVNQLYRQREE